MAAETDLMKPLVDNIGTLQVLVNLARKKHEVVEGNEIGGCEVCCAVEIAEAWIKHEREQNI